MKYNAIFCHFLSKLCNYIALLSLDLKPCPFSYSSHISHKSFWKGFLVIPIISLTKDPSKRIINVTSWIIFNLFHLHILIWCKRVFQCYFYLDTLSFLQMEKARALGCHIRQLHRQNALCTFTRWRRIEFFRTKISDCIFLISFS